MPILIITIFLLTVTKLIYDRIFTRYDKVPTVPPALTGMVQMREIYPFLSGNHLLTGYLYRTAKPAHGLILLSPGFRAGGDDYLELISKLLARGWSIFTFDPTGTYRSQGKNQVGFSQCIPDLQESLKYVEKNQYFGYNRLVLMGHSRGAYAACCAIAHRKDVSAVVSISGMNSAMEGIMGLSRNAVGPLCYGNYGFLWLYQVLLFGRKLLTMQAAPILSRQNIPALIIHGAKDRLIPPERCSLFKKKIHAPRIEYCLCNAGHTDLLQGQNDTLISTIHHFLLRAV